MTPEVERLNAYRMERDWTFTQLAQAMANVGAYISPNTLYYLCVKAPDAKHHRDRTVYKILKFLAHIDARSSSRASR